MNIERHSISLKKFRQLNPDDQFLHLTRLCRSRHRMLFAKLSEEERATFSQRYREEFVQRADQDDE